ncbi:Transporter [Fasciola hepatica]|uniref:Transporter n=1 Tax=Fasciola hepatica TaxID=6192 RepID=A0A4E0RD03_FASHE|nr:Transporter [Fasciola hepatica]
MLPNTSLPYMGNKNGTGAPKTLHYALDPDEISRAAYGLNQATVMHPSTDACVISAPNYPSSVSQAIAHSTSMPPVAGHFQGSAAPGIRSDLYPYPSHPDMCVPLPNYNAACAIRHFGMEQESAPKKINVTESNSDQIRPDQLLTVEGADKLDPMNGGGPPEGASDPTVPVNVSKGKTRETWDTKVDFLLAVIGFAVDLGNIWRFPFICYRNGGGAFLIPYLVMYIFGGLPLFYLELALGQFQRSGCLTVWKRICPMFSGVGFGICVISSYTAWYYNTIMAWALFYMFDAMKPHVPWSGCGNWWNTNSCVTVHERLLNYSVLDDAADGLSDVLSNLTLLATIRRSQLNRTAYSSTEEYFYRRVLQIQYATGYDNIGPVRWEIALCLIVIFTIVYFSLWKGVKSSGKAVWVTATVPYVILSILLVRGLTLEGSLTGIKYYLTPDFASLLKISVWSDAASQIFFSLGPGFGVLLALSSYNKFHNNCYRDAMVTSFINCATSFVSGFVVFSVLGHMCFRMGKTMEEAANEGPGLVFVAYPEAIATLKGSTFWAIIFMLMLITLGLDSTFGGLEAIITGILDRIPQLRRRRELFVLGIIIYCFVGALATTTCGGYLILNLLDRHGAPISILFIVFCECVALCWFYGTKRFCNDIKLMLGFTPGKFWQICWTFISPLFLLGIFIANLVSYEFPPVTVLGATYTPPTWVIVTAWLIVFSSVIFIPTMMIVQFLTAKGSCRDRLRYLITPEDRPTYSDQRILAVEPNESALDNPIRLADEELQEKI